MPLLSLLPLLLMCILYDSNALAYWSPSIIAIHGIERVWMQTILYTTWIHVSFFSSLILISFTLVSFIPFHCVRFDWMDAIAMACAYTYVDMNSTMSMYWWDKCHHSSHYIWSHDVHWIFQWTQLYVYIPAVYYYTAYI